MTDAISPPQTAAPPPRTAADAAHPERVLRFEDLAGDGSEVLIEHAGRVYRLRRTRQGKLLLNR